MRRPRLLALLLLLAALLALGAWTLMHERPAAVENALASAPETERHSDAPLALEPELAPQRQDAAAAISPAAPLANSDRIHGRVVHGPLALPAAGVEVSCAKLLPKTRLEGPAGIMAAKFPPPEDTAVRCTSAPDGSFEFKDLDRSALYTLRASGLGWVMLEPLAAIPPSEEERTLGVGRIYVARVIATDENDVPIVQGCQYLRYARVAGPGECKSLPITDAPRRPSPDGKAVGEVYDFASDCDTPSLGPFRILICCSGFERQDFEFWAYPEGFRTDMTTFRLRRSQDQAGMLRVRQECGCAAVHCEHLLEGTLELESVDGTQKPQSFDLGGLVREQVFTQVPAGAWRARVRAKYGGFCHPAADLPAVEVTIGEAPAQFEVPVANLGAIRFLGTIGETRMAEIPITWLGSEGSVGTASLWTSLVMRGVMSGTQFFECPAASCEKVEGGRFTLRGEKLNITVDVVAGETLTVTMHAP